MRVEPWECGEKYLHLILRMKLRTGNFKVYRFGLWGSCEKFGNISGADGAPRKPAPFFELRAQICGESWFLVTYILFPLELESHTLHPT